MRTVIRLMGEYSNFDDYDAGDIGVVILGPLRQLASVAPSLLA